MNKFKTKIYTTADLQAPEARQVLAKVVGLINEVYHVHEDFLDERRFEQDSDLWSALGNEGLCAVLYDDENGADDINVIATVNARAWGHQEVHTRHKLEDGGDAKDTDGSEYEIFAVACRMDPHYKHKGLAMETTEALIAALPCFNGPGALESTVLWVKVADHNKQYWLRRGFTVTKSQPAKAGFWGCKKDFTIWTMKKQFENPNL